MIRSPIYLAAILTAAASALLLSARAGQSAMRWVIGRAIQNTLG
jgi:hypothetical protein